jgi:hypothetical protein
MLHSHYITGTFSSRPSAACSCRSYNAETLSARLEAVNKIDGITSDL